MILPGKYYSITWRLSETTAEIILGRILVEIPRDLSRVVFRRIHEELVE